MTSYDSSTTKLRSPNVPAKLAYNGELIHDRGDMLSLTDMWRAAGSDSVKAPAQWQRLSQAIEFIEHVGLIVGNSHNNLVKTGKRGGTFAHWQIALAYAKYLSPEFHVWCNTVVRERMEGKVVKPHGFELDAPARMAIGGIVKSVIRANLTDMVGELVEQAINSDPRRSAMDGMSVRQLLDEAKTAQKGRNGINRKIGYELRERAALSSPPVTLYRCAHSGVWLFPRTFALAYMEERGHTLVKAHNDKVKGQGVFKLVLDRKPNGEAHP